MSQNNSGSYMDYMDGVPVKLSDKCKPPPEITLPHGVVESSARANELLQNIHYDFSLETNVLKKLVEWQNAREMVRNARNHRLQLLEEARQRELDLKAANESEEKLKQLSISEISYPSTEDISEISPDDKEESQSGNEAAVSGSVQCEAPAPAETQQDTTMFTNFSIHKPELVCDILQPVPVSTSCSQWAGHLNLLDDAPLTLPQLPRIQHNLHYIKNKYMKNNLDNLTYLDFENDTSSPFDNMELKTINDKELLAQVLNSNQSNNVSSSLECTSSVVNQNQHYDPFGTNQQFHNSHSIHNNIENSNICKPVYSNCTENTNSNTTTLTNPLQPYPYNPGGLLHTNGYYEPPNNMSIASGTYYAPDYLNYSSVGTSGYQQPIPSDKTYAYNNDKLADQTTYNSQYQRDVNSINHAYNVNPYEYYNSNYSFYPNNSHVNNMTYLPLNNEPTKTTGEEEPAVLKTDNSDSKTMFGTRSRSVPDIVKELDKEVAMARMRAKERSHNCSPSIRPNSESVSGNIKVVEKLVDPYQDLSPELQGICKRISMMGFPLDRVARACEELGAQDKRIIEYLLVMGQLMDLGFPESSVCKALLKHNCNRDKALDELIS